MNKSQSFKNSLILMGLLALWIPQLQAIAGKSAAAAAPRRYIFSRSTQQTTSSALGITGVAAYVNFPDGSQRRGIYVTGTQAGAAGLSIGLRPGRVLVSIDNRVTESCSAVDSILGSRSGNFEVSYVKLVDGLPQLVRSSANFGGPRLGMAPPVTADLSASSSPGKLITDNTPLNQLESYMVTLINKDRSANGKPSLSESSRLSDLARSYAEWLLSHGAFSHTADGRDPLIRAKAVGISCGIAENLAFQTRTKPEKELVAAAEATFMAEPPNQRNHRFNILWDEGKAVGVGMARNKSTLMMVQEFADTNP